MLTFTDINLYLYKKICASVVRRTYWLYEQHSTYGNLFARRLNRYAKNWTTWAKAEIGTAHLPKTTNLNLNLKNILSYPSPQSKT